MSPEEISQREQELRIEHPQIFAHPELRPNEVWLGDCLVDLVHSELFAYHQNGIPSARIGEMSVPRRVHGVTYAHFPIFAKLREVILAQEQLKQRGY